MSVLTASFQNKNDFLKTQCGLNISSFTCVNANISAISQFSSYDKLKLPFLITGRLLTVGEYKETGHGFVKMKEDVLKESLSDWVGVNIFSSHDVFARMHDGIHVSINEVLGKIVKTVWNEKDGGIDFFAEIYDRDVAFKIANDLIKFISPGFGRNIVSQSNELFYHDLQPIEASLVFDPRDENAVFAPAE